jgi:hypothetical protein
VDTLLALTNVKNCCRTGYGYGKTVMKQSSFLGVLPYFLLAIFLHGFYNFLVSYEFFGALSALGLAFLFVIIAIILNS